MTSTKNSQNLRTETLRPPQSQHISGVGTPSAHEQIDAHQIAVDDHPNGYPRLAALLNSDENFLICRKYGFLHNRVLLYRQDELRELEEQLLAVDKVAEKQNDGTLECRVRGERCSGQQRDLMNRIDDKLREYNDIVQRTRAFASLQKATPRNHKSVCNWLNHAAPLVKEEAETFDKDRDFVALVDAKEGSWFDGAVETALSRFGGKFTRVFLISPSALPHPSNPSSKCLSPSVTGRARPTNSSASTPNAASTSSPASSSPCSQSRCSWPPSLRSSALRRPAASRS